MRMRKVLIWAVFAVMLLAAIPVKAAPDPGIVGLWHFDTVDATTDPHTTPDSSGLNNHGSLYPVGSEPTLTLGKFGKALSFNGVDEYVEMSDAIVGTEHFTIEAWINPSSISAGHFPPRWMDIIVTGNKVPAYSWYLGLAASQLCLWYYGSGWKYLGWIGTNQWQHVVAVIDGASGVANNLKGYINGVNTYTGTLTYALSTTTSKPWIGSRSDYAQYAGWFDGVIDEVRIWNGALTLAQIQQSYALGIETEATVELGEQFLADGGVAIFTSAFYWPSGGAWTFPVTLEARVMIVGSGAYVTGCVERKVTPRGTVSWTPVVFTDGVDVTVTAVSGGAKSLHLTMVLSTTEGLGFNIQNLPYD